MHPANRDWGVVPYATLDTVFFDVGNTLISIDFGWVASEVAGRGYACTADCLKRAEAAARPEYSFRCVHGSIPQGDLFAAYLSAMLGKTDGTAHLPPDELDSLVAEIRPVLRPDGRASALWRSVMPRVPEALVALRQLGLTLVVVSNSDGTVERSLETAGLRAYFSAVIDSAVAGYEKPDARIFSVALDRCGARPDHTLHVGDLYHADVVGARGAGLHAVLLDPFGDWSVDDCERLPDVWSVAERIREARRSGSAAISPSLIPDP
jgi:HAD superfamily hydrolase (TIGR01509 family)